MAEIAALATSAISSMAKGSQDRKLAYAEAQALREASMRKAAATTAEMGQEQRTKEYMESRAIALAAFQGGGVDDPSVTNLIADVNAEGEYRILSTLYTGMGEAAGMQFASEQAMRSGDIAMERGYMKAITTVLSSHGSDMWGGGEAPKLSHATKARGANLGTMDFNPISGAAVYG